MAKTLTEFFRDPIWQGIGAVLALFALLIPLLTAPSVSSGKLVFAPYDRLRSWQVLSSYNRAEEDLQILWNGERIPPQELVTVTCDLYNKSASAITPSDFYEPITVSPIEGVKIISAQRLSPNKAAEADWKRNSNGSFSFRSQLLNPGDYIYVEFVLWIPGIGDKPLEDKKVFEINGKIKDVNFISYDSASEAYQGETDIHAYVNAGLSGMYSYMSGRGIVAMFAIATVMLFIQILLLRAAQLLPDLSRLMIGILLSIFFLTTTTSEITVSRVIEGMPQHPLVYILLALHGFLIIFIATRAYFRRSIETKQKSVESRG